MIIKRATYKELLNRSELADELEKETERLAALITSETKDCKMGIWCKECMHRGVDYSKVIGDSWLGDYVIAEGGKVYYCKKHLHEICPEFEQEKNNG